MTGPGMSIPSGWLTVEQAGAMLDLEPWRVRDLAVLGGIPLGYGPFPRITGSDFRVFIDEADAKAWDEAGRPLNSRYRVLLLPSRTKAPPPPPPQSGQEWERARRPNLDSRTSPAARLRVGLAVLAGAMISLAVFILTAANS